MYQKVIPMYLVFSFDIFITAVSLRELCSKSSSLFYSEFPQTLHSQNLMINLNFTGNFMQLFSVLQSKASKIFYSLCILLSVVVKCSVTSVWGYELLRADRSIRVSDCSIKLSWSGKSLCQVDTTYDYALKLHQNSRIILDSFTPSLFLTSIIPASLNSRWFAYKIAYSDNS